MLKSREIDDILRNRGFEAGTRHILHELVEAQIALNHAQTELASTALKLMQMIEGVAGGYLGLRTKLESIDRSVKFEKEFDGDK